MKTTNRSTHYNKKKHSIRSKVLMFYMDAELLNKVDFIAKFDKQSRSRVVERVIRYFLLRKQGVKNGIYKASAKCYKKSKKNKVLASTRNKRQRKEAHKKEQGELYGIFEDRDG